ncbi:hypothetical protein CsSME_00025459 [Camellia sinensis var. sinensis]
MKYFEEKVHAGEWEEVEKYLSGFTKVDDNKYSMKIFFEIRKQKCMEALDWQDKAKAVDILVNELKVFSTFNEELYKEITQLSTLGNFSSHPKPGLTAPEGGSPKSTTAAFLPCRPLWLCRPALSTTVAVSSWLADSLEVF